MEQDDAKVREEKGRWRQNKTGDATGRSKSKSEKGGCAGQEMVRQDGNGATGQEMAVRTRDGVSGKDKKRTPGKGCAGVRN